MFAISQTDDDSWAVETEFLRNPIDREILRAAGLPVDTKTKDLPLYEAQELCSVLNEWFEKQTPARRSRR